MTQHRRLVALGLALFTLWLAVWAWQNPGSLGLAQISAADKTRYLQVLQSMPFPTEQRAALIKHVNAWIASDDGQPVYMLNLMRFNEPLRRFPGAPADFQGTARQSNEIYEAAAKPLLLKQGAYPRYAGSVQGHNLMGAEPAFDDWSRVLLVRYPSRRAFLELLANPAFTAVVAYKLMALDVYLVPTTDEMQIPELSWLFGALFLIVLLAFGWFEAARRDSGIHPARRPRHGEKRG